MLRTSVIVSGLSLVASLISFANQLLIARLWGATASMDAYLIAISVPYLMMGVTSGLFSFSLVPILVRYRLLSPSRYMGLSWVLLVAFTSWAILISLGAFFLTPVIIRIMAPTMQQALMDETILMARISWITYGCTVIVSYFVALQNAAKKFIIPVLTSALPYLGMITFILLLSHEIGPIALVCGMLVGNLIAVLLLYIWGRQEIGYQAVPLAIWKEAWDMFKPMPLVMVSMLCFMVYGTINAFWASRLGPSTVSFLGYGERLLIAIGNIVVLGPMTVLLPHLSETVAQGHDWQFRSDTQRALRMVVTFAAMIAVVASVLRVAMVKLLFERGTFDNAATLGVASVLPGMFLGMVAMLNVVILFRAFYAKGDVVGAAMIGGLGSVVYFVLSGFLSQMMGLNGIVIAYAVTWWILLGCVVTRFYHGTWRELFNLENLKFLWQLALALGICGLIALGGNTFLIHPALGAGGVDLLVRLMTVAGLAVVSFMSISGGIFKMREVTVVMRLLPLEQIKINMCRFVWGER